MEPSEHEFYFHSAVICLRVRSFRIQDVTNYTWYLDAVCRMNFKAEFYENWGGGGGMRYKYKNILTEKNHDVKS